MFHGPSPSSPISCSSGPTSRGPYAQLPIAPSSLLHSPLVLLSSPSRPSAFLGLSTDQPSSYTSRTDFGRARCSSCRIASLLKYQYIGFLPNSKITLVMLLGHSLVSLSLLLYLLQFPGTFPYSLTRFISYDKFSSSHGSFVAMFNAAIKPTLYLDASCHPKWHLAMQQEVDALLKNNTWTLTTLPPAIALLAANGFTESSIHQMAL